MNYARHYDLLIEKAQARHTPEGYTERHHVIPKSLGGTDSPENLVVLTAREHFIAHFLLSKIHGGKMWHAISFMGKRLGMTGRLYEVARIKIGQVVSARNKHRWSDTENRKKQSEAAKLRYSDPEYRAKMGDAISAALRDPEARKKNREAQKRAWADPNLCAKQKELTNIRWADPKFQEKVREGHKRRWADPEARKKRSDMFKRLWADPEFRKRVMDGKATSHQKKLNEVNNDPLG